MRVGRAVWRRGWGELYGGEGGGSYMEERVGRAVWRRGELNRGEGSLYGGEESCIEVRGAVQRGGWGELYRGEESCMEVKGAV